MIDEKVKDWLMRKFCLSPSEHIQGKIDHDCDRSERLEKALDKACEELENYASSYESPWCGRPFTKDQWKEWCMKDVE